VAGGSIRPTSGFEPAVDGAGRSWDPRWAREARLLAATERTRFRGPFSDLREADLAFVRFAVKTFG
jgi:hypothetical protein